MSALDNRFEIYNTTTLAGYIQTYSNNIGIISGINYQIVISATNEVHCFDCSLRVDGALNVTGTKNFKIPHPLDKERWLKYSSIESNGVFLDIHGHVEIKNNKAKIVFPTYHPAVTSGIPIIQLTKVGWFGDLYVEKADETGFVIVTQGAPDGVKVNWYARSSRKGFENEEVEPLIEDWEKANDLGHLQAIVKNSALYPSIDVQEAKNKLGKKRKEIADFQKNMQRKFREEGE